MTGKNKISVIVTAYNVEKYIDRCLGSLVDQTIKDIEIIVVEDGATDSTSKICDEWRKKDSRIKVVHSQNKGVSAARNTGISLSTGKWITFVDGDDYVNGVFLEKMLERADEDGNRAQIVLCDYSIEKKNRKRIISFFDDDETLCGQNEKLIKKVWGINDNSYGTRFGTVWAKLYDREYLEKIDAKFDENLSLCEDLIFNTAVFDKASECKYIKNTLYYYTVRKDSLTKGFDSDAIEKVYYLIPKISEALVNAKNCMNSIDVLDFMKIRLLNMLITRHILNKSNLLSIDQKYNLYKEICSSEPFAQMIQGEGAFFSFKQKMVKRLLYNKWFLFSFLLWLIAKGR